jgi:acetyl-CoA carboxylase biotin carboxyl carrier protein
MSLTAADVAEIMRLLEGSSFDELNIELDGMKLSLRRAGAAADMRPVQQSNAVPAPPQRAPAAAKVLDSDPNFHAVKAPLLGTFYRAPKPGAPPFVELGSAVEADTVVGIIEVMKLMNTVRAGVRGKVVEILAGDGALVEFDETILRIAKSG